jgi:type I site-specific restriction endonuclease
LKTFIEADALKMKGHFADKVLVMGTPVRFAAADAKRNKPAELTAEQLAAGYAKMFDQIGRDKWNETLKKTKPTLSKATKDGEHIELAKAGDYVYDLHFREAVKGKRAGLDEAVIFVFRSVGGKYRIVGHFADY